MPTGGLLRIWECGRWPPVGYSAPHTPVFWWPRARSRGSTANGTVLPLKLVCLWRTLLDQEILPRKGGPPLSAFIALRGGGATPPRLKGQGGGQLA